MVLFDVFVSTLKYVDHPANVFKQVQRCLKLMNIPDHRLHLKDSPNFQQYLRKVEQ